MDRRSAFRARSAGALPLLVALLLTASFVSQVDTSTALGVPPPPVGSPADTLGAWPASTAPGVVTQIPDSGGIAATCADGTPTNTELADDLTLGYINPDLWGLPAGATGTDDVCYTGGAQGDLTSVAQLQNVGTTPATLAYPDIEYGQNIWGSEPGGMGSALTLPAYVSNYTTLPTSLWLTTTYDLDDTGGASYDFVWDNWLTTWKANPNSPGPTQPDALEFMIWLSTSTDGNSVWNPCTYQTCENAGDLPVDINGTISEQDWNWVDMDAGSCSTSHSEPGETIAYYYNGAPDEMNSPIRTFGVNFSAMMLNLGTMLSTYGTPCWEYTGTSITSFYLDTLELGSEYLTPNSGEPGNGDLALSWSVSSICYAVVNGAVSPSSLGCGGSSTPPPLAISTFSATPASLDLGSSTTFAVSASGGTGPLSYRYTGLPAGCTSSNISAFSCTPAQAGASTVRVYVNDSAGHSATATTSVTVTVPAALAISSFGASPSSIPLGSSTYFQVVATGGTGTYAYDYTGVPTGCAASSTASWSCVPTAAGSYDVRVFVNDTAGASVNALAPLTVTGSTSGSPPSITGFTAIPNAFSLGGSTDLAVAESGGTAPITYTFTGLPPGCVSSDAPSLGCTPTTTGTFTVWAFANDSVGRSASSSVSFTVEAAGSSPIALSSFTASPSTVFSGSSTSFDVVASGGSGALSYAFAGMPAGCGGEDLASFACSPSAAGSYTPRVYVNDSAGASATSTTSLTVQAASTSSGPTSSGGSALPPILDLPGYYGYLLVALVVAAVAIGAAVGVARRRRQQPPPPDGPYAAPGLYEASFPGPPPGP